MIWVVLRSIRLFWLGFCLALSAAMWSGIYAGSFTRADVQIAVIQQTAQFLGDHPEILGWSMEAMGYQSATLTAEETAALPQSSLDALKSRSRVSN